MKARRLAGCLLLIAVAAFLCAGFLLFGEGILEKIRGFRRSLRPAEPLVVTVIDVGQASAALIQSGDTDILIDCGERADADRLTAELAAAGVERLSAVIVTHLHTDHFGGLVDLLDRFPVEEVVLPFTPEELTPTNKTYERLLEALARTRTPVTLQTAPLTRGLSEGAALTFLDGFLPAPEELNDTSLCLRVDCGSVSFLFTGDGEGPLQEQLLKKGALVSADVYVAGHHGSDSSSGLRFLNAVRPVCSAVSVGSGNDYGLPGKKAMERLSAFGPVYRTDLVGSIRFATDGSSLRVTAAGVDDTLIPRED